MVERQIRFSTEELSLIKNTFAENDDLLKMVRKVMLQLPLNKQEKAIINSTFRNKKELMNVMRRSFLPEIEGDSHIHQVIDLWMTVDIKDKIPEEAYPHLIARGMLIDYLEQQLNVLNGAKGVTIKLNMFLDEMGNAEEEKVYIYLTFRNTMITHTEQQISQLSVLAGYKEETVEETLKRNLQDSSK